MQAQRVEHHRYRRECHGSSTNDGRNDAKRCKWHRNSVVDKRQEHVLPNGDDGGAREANGAQNGAQIAVDEGQSGRFNGDVGTSSF